MNNRTTIDKVLLTIILGLLSALAAYAFTQHERRLSKVEDKQEAETLLLAQFMATQGEQHKQILETLTEIKEGKKEGKGN